MTDLNPIFIGATVFLAAAAIVATMVLSPKNRATFVYAQIVLMVGIYVGFAVAGLDPLESARKAAWSAVLIESIVAMVFVMIGLNLLSGAKAWMLGALILAHSGVDLAHLLMGAAHSPDWYEFLCLIFDAIVGVGVIWLLSEKTPQN